jgi:hypothetical protein
MSWELAEGSVSAPLQKERAVIWRPFPRDETPAPSAVDSVTSQKTTVTVFRTSRLPRSPVPR